MSTGYLGKTSNSPRQMRRVQSQQQSEARMGEMPGEIVSFDPVTQTASIQPLYRPTHNGEAVDMPVLEEVPMRFSRAGGGRMTFPVRVGDKVVLRPQSRSSEEYHVDGTHEPTDRRSASLSDMEAFMDGGESLSDPIQGFDNEATHIGPDDAGEYGVRMYDDGTFKIDGSQGNVFDLLAQVVELLAADQLQINYGSSAGSGHQLQNRAQYASIAGKLRAMAK